MVRYKPVIPLTIIGPNGQTGLPALVDSGADDVVLPVHVAARIGVDLAAALAGQARGLGGNQPVGLLYAPVILLLSDGTQTCRWRAVAAFTPTPLRFAIFGIAGGLEHFRATLDIGDRELTLLPKPSLPAATTP
jgi:hypothetical protein